MAGQIIRWRNNNSFESLVDLLQVRSGGDNNNGEGGNNNNESEDSNSGNNVISQDFLISIGDSITTGEAKVGCVNINSASKEVLTCLDGLEGELAEAIVNHRSSSGYFKNILEILNVAGMTVEKFRAIENRICVRSETYRIYSEGLVPASNISRRLETIVQINSSGIKNIAQRIVD
ncbi:MAG: helix-hairpin-helix domain-containing protein [Bacteroides graminisolvens]|nr:helix-hairpin-helix domain-containing protein [Bacteroides graminisolvens]